ncbi:MAG: TlpA family protein disulfide reductase [Burkholderiaceae bacterium]|nr:TlpA family protein disulfide reductase [Burkholderiaceae bacterium]
MKNFDRIRRSLLALPLAACTPGLARAAQAGGEQADVEALAFVPGSFREILASGAGRPVIVHLWGLTCAPCIVELPRWAAFVRGHPRANVAFVQTDPMPAQRVAAALRRAGLQGARHWSAPAPLDERARYEIDPDWAGELPRTVLIGVDGRRSGVSGAVAFERVRAWLARQGVRG